MHCADFQAYCKETLVIFKLGLEHVYTSDMPLVFSYYIIVLVKLNDMSYASQYDVSSTLLQYHHHHQVA